NDTAFTLPEKWYRHYHDCSYHLHDRTKNQARPTKGAKSQRSYLSQQSRRPSTSWREWLLGRGFRPFLPRPCVLTNVVRSAAPRELGAGRGWGSLHRVNPGRLHYLRFSVTTLPL
ncbi:unnamed protein product, partial [Nezara viridula]